MYQGEEQCLLEAALLQLTDSSGSSSGCKTHSSELEQTPSGSGQDATMSMNNVPLVDRSLFTNSKIFSQTTLHSKIFLLFPEHVPGLVFV